MLKKIGLPALVAGAFLTLFSPSPALAQRHGGGGRNFSGGRAFSGGGGYYRGGGTFGRGWGGGFREHDRDWGRRYYGGSRFYFGYGAPYAYGQGYYSGYCDPAGYYDRWGNFRYYPGCVSYPY